MTLYLLPEEFHYFIMFVVTDIFYSFLMYFTLYLCPDISRPLFLFFLKVFRLRCFLLLHFFSINLKALILSVLF